MRFTDLTVLLPCHSLEDFPLYLEGSQADELLAAWCALWHPTLIAGADSLPGWNRVDIPPEAVSGRLMTIAPYCLDRLPAGFDGRANSEGGRLIKAQNLQSAVAEALAHVEPPSAPCDEPLAYDFLALGFCRLQIELLTRLMRYSTNIDETHFRNETLAAAHQAVVGNIDESRQHMQQCFETLCEARKHFYPVDVHLLDITLLASTTLGPSLRRELSVPTATNLLGTMDLLSQLAKEQQQSWSALLAAMDDGRVCVLGGECQEIELPLLPNESVRMSIGNGVRRYEELFGRRPQVYGRRRSGLWPGLPQLLVKHGYNGALHFTLDDGRFPVASQCKTRWEGLDGSVLDIFARLPGDAAKHESMLGLSRTMADSMDSDHDATVAMAHWPGQVTGWYEMLRRVAQLSPVLGKFIRLDDYFSHTDMPGRISKFEADEYRTPYLQQAIIGHQSDPISTFVRAHRKGVENSSIASVTTLSAFLKGKSATDDACSLCGVNKPPGSEAADLQHDLAQLAAALPRADGDPSAARYLLVNPLSFARRMGIEMPALANPPAVHPPAIASSLAGERKFAVVEVPAMGFAWVESGAAPPTHSRAKPIALENVLRNEFFELTISRTSGGIQSLYNYRQRGNQLSQQIAFRLPAPATEAGTIWPDTDEGHYTSMRADSVETTIACRTLGEIVSRGQLVDGDGRALAGFRQTTRVWAGSRIVELNLELESVEEPRADPWNSYYAARFAWPDETAELYRGVPLGRSKTTSKRLEAAEYIDIDNGSSRISLLTGGLPYHRRSADRMLDSLLVVRGETARQFHLAIGIDLPQPAAATMELLTPSTVLLDIGAAPKLASGWFFHLDAKNVVATDWRPWVDDPPQGEPAGVVLPIKGFRARLLETAGRAGRVNLRSFRNVASARQVDCLGQTMLDLSVEGDKITLDFAAHEWIEVVAAWDG